MARAWCSASGRAQQVRGQWDGDIHEDAPLYYFRRWAEQLPVFDGATDMATWDDLQFFDRLIATIAASKPRLDVERVYVSGIFCGLHDDAFYCPP